MFWYCVCPVADKWCVTFDTQRRSFIYDTEQLAIEAAMGAAERNWKKRSVPSGVQVKDGDDWRTEWLFGYLPERVPGRAGHKRR